MLTIYEACSYIFIHIDAFRRAVHDRYEFNLMIRKLCSGKDTIRRKWDSGLRCPAIHMGSIRASQVHQAFHRSEVGKLIQVLSGRTVALSRYIGGPSRVIANSRYAFSHLQRYLMSRMHGGSLKDCWTPRALFFYFFRGTIDSHHLEARLLIIIHGSLRGRLLSV